MVTVFGTGSTAGPVYTPVPEIVPSAADPPATPFTCHVTAALVVPVTFAENNPEPFNRKELGPLTVTVTVTGGTAASAASVPAEHPKPQTSPAIKTKPSRL
jgi:hypothetical protein